MAFEIQALTPSSQGSAGSFSKINLPSSGAAPTAGLATLASGTVTVASTAVTANSVIVMSNKTDGGTIGTYTYTVSAGVSFTITSSNVLDTSVMAWILVN